MITCEPCEAPPGVGATKAQWWRYTLTTANGLTTMSGWRSGSKREVMTALTKTLSRVDQYAAYNRWGTQAVAKSLRAKEAQAA